MNNKNCQMNLLKLHELSEINELIKCNAALKSSTTDSHAAV